MRTRASGPIPLYTQPTCSVSSVILATVASSMRAEESFFSVAITTPSSALMPRLVAPAATAFSAAGRERRCETGGAARTRGGEREAGATAAASRDAKLTILYLH
jgi:hypothetical protein